MSEAALAEVSVERGELRQRVRSTLTRLSRTGALPTLPAAASAALGIARDPDADVQHVCEVIQIDVGLAARIIRAANSAALARRNPAKSLRDAVLTVGLRKTCDILVAMCARQLYEGADAHAEMLWNHALAVGLGTEQLAYLTRAVDPSSAFLPGLFHDIGRIAFVLADPMAAEVIDRLADAGEGAKTSLEREWYDFDHGEAGAILAEEWGLALEQCDAIRLHHRPPANGSGGQLAALINAADGLAYTLGYGSSAVQPVEISTARIGLGADDEREWSERVGAAIAQQQELLGT